MARLPWLVRARIESVWNSSDSSRKQIFMEISYFIKKLYVMLTHYNRLIETILMTTHSISLLYRWTKTSLNYDHLLPDMAPWLTPEARTTHFSNKFPWYQRCSSHWGFTVHRNPVYRYVFLIEPEALIMNLSVQRIYRFSLTYMILLSLV